jgi:hypothetical protein
VPSCRNNMRPCEASFWGRSYRFVTRALVTHAGFAVVARRAGAPRRFTPDYRHPWVASDRIAERVVFPVRLETFYSIHH